MRTLIIGDIHIDDSCIEELKAIFEEIRQREADRIILLGDLFHHNKPTPNEIAFATKLIYLLKKQYKEVIILTGTGRHEFIDGIPIVTYLKHLKAIIKEGEYRTTIDNKYCLFGHFMLHESKLEYGTGKYGIKDLKEYDIVLLGHQHSLQFLVGGGQAIWHIGSIRYVNWNESSDKYKEIALIEDGKLKFIELKTPIKMVDVTTLEELEKLDKNVKARLIIKKWQDYKNWANRFPKWKKKFVEFKVKLDFEKIKIEKSTKNVSFGEKFKEIKDKDIKKELEEEFKQEGLI